LSGDSYRPFAKGADTFLQLAGVSHPSPAKAAQFRKIDLKAGLEAVRVAREVDIHHFIYVSVAQPAPVMHAYQAIRAECEQVILRSGLSATILRPWYVLGPAICGLTASLRVIRLPSSSRRRGKVPFSRDQELPAHFSTALLQLAENLCQRKRP
jgi:uncharacterized protein YbjT (DUF2867 family)